MTTDRKVQRSLVGRVVSNKMDKTVTVLIERKVKHPVYGKYMTQSTKLHAHDESNAINEGDLVEIVAAKPRAKTKSWAVARVVETGRTL
ncbi:MAG: 30S ribosomal protein S17 [Betaproteobacteria bacterium]